MKVTDADDNTATADFTVTVQDVTERATPTITGVADATVNENEEFTSATPGVSGHIGTPTWSLEGTDAADFTIDSATGVVSMVARDFENPVDANTENDYEATVKVTDADGNTATADFTVTVVNTPETATLTISGVADAAVDENLAFVSATPSVSGGPVGTPTWSLEGTDAADFTIDSATGVVRMAARDFEDPEDEDENNVYVASVRVRDSDNNTADVAFAVTVRNVRETATVTITGVVDAAVNENEGFMSAEPGVSGHIGEATWSLEGDDAEDFTIDPATGVVSMVARDFEAPVDENRNNDYEATVKVTDDDGNTAMASFTVTVGNLGETATLTISGVADGEVGEGQEFTMTVSVRGHVGRAAWSLEGPDEDDFHIFALTGANARVRMVPRDHENPQDADKNNVYQATVRVTDDDGNTDSASFAVTVRDETAPDLDRATVNGASLVLTFDEPLDANSAPAASAFRVTVDGSPATLADTNAVAVSGSAVTLTLASAVTFGDEVTVDYTAPAGMDAMPIRDAAGNNAANLSGEAVTNNTPRPPPPPPPNRAPVAEGTIADRTLSAGEAAEVYLPRFFSDPDDDGLSYTASSSNPEAVEVGVSGAVLTLTPVAVGRATVTVTAGDGTLSAVQSFAATVESAPGGSVTVSPTAPGADGEAGGYEFAPTLPGEGRVSVTAPDGTPHEIEVHVGTNVPTAVTVTLPASEVARVDRLEITRPADRDAPALERSSGFKLTSTVLDVTLLWSGEPAPLQSPVTVCLPVPAEWADLPDADLALYRYAGGAWTVLEARAAMRGGTRVLCAETTEFSLFAVAAPLSGDAGLAALGVSVADAETLNEAFDPDTTDYTAEAPADTAEATVVATPRSGGASVTLSGTSASGAALEVVDDDTVRGLTWGDNAIEIAVTAEDGESAQTYRVTLTVAASADAGLAALGVSVAGTETLNEAFDPDTTDYTAEAPPRTAEARVVATPRSGGASVTLSGTSASGAALEVDGDNTVRGLTRGDNAIEIAVTAEDGESAQTYRVTLTVVAAALTVAWGGAEYALTEGGAGPVAVVLGAAADRTVRIPLTVSPAPDVLEGVPEAVTFAPGESRVEFIVTALVDGDADDAEAVLEFGALPGNVTAGRPALARVAVTDVDKAAAARFERLNETLLGRQALLLMDDVTYAVDSRLNALDSSQFSGNGQFPDGQFPGSFSLGGHSDWAGLWTAAAQTLGRDGRIDGGRLLGDSSFALPLPGFFNGFGGNGANPLSGVTVWARATTTRCRAGRRTVRAGTVSAGRAR